MPREDLLREGLVEVLAVVEELLDLTHGLLVPRPQAPPEVVDDVPHAPGVGDPLDEAAALGEDDDVEGLDLHVPPPRVGVFLQQLVDHDAELHHPGVLSQIPAPLGLAEEGVHLPVRASEGEFLRPLLGPEHVHGLQAPVRAHLLGERLERYLRLVPHQRDLCGHLGLQRDQDVPLLSRPLALSNQLGEVPLQAHGRRVLVGRRECRQRVEVHADVEVHDHGPVDHVVGSPDLEEHVLPQLLVLPVRRLEELDYLPARLVRVRHQHLHDEACEDLAHVRVVHAADQLGQDHVPHPRLHGLGLPVDLRQGVLLVQVQLAAVPGQLQDAVEDEVQALVATVQGLQVSPQGEGHEVPQVKRAD
mmetsp:Transcript_105083/g.313925  ORF Transcript_105083/g.313925 Transcript_105083/m.313925 type:complete len:360 (-) Transcript_105083:542-1621(-)